MENDKNIKKIRAMAVSDVYPHYITKVERKGRKASEVNEIICWLTGYTQKQVDAELDKGTNFETFFKKAPHMNPSRSLVKGMICGVRVEEIKDPIFREVRYMDKLVDELAKGRPMEKILRKE